MKKRNYIVYSHAVLSEERILEVVFKIRKLTIRQDLWRHRWALFRIKIGLGINDEPHLQEIREWIWRLEEILEKQKQAALDWYRKPVVKHWAWKDVKIRYTPPPLVNQRKEVDCFLDAWAYYFETKRAESKGDPAL